MQDLLARGLRRLVEALRRERVEQLAQPVELVLGNRPGGELLLDRLGDHQVDARAREEAGRVVAAVDRRDERVARPA